MAVKLDQIRSTAERVGTSFGLDIVDVEVQGNGKFRTLRVFLEKDAAGRAELARQAEETAETAGTSDTKAEQLPKGVPAEMLSGVTHEDCAKFARDFGTVLDVEDLMEGGEYTLEVSSPGLDRKLLHAADYVRFTGSLVKLQTFTAVNGNRQWRGRVLGVKDEILRLDLAAVKQKGKAKRATEEVLIEIPLKDIERASLVPEF